MNKYEWLQTINIDELVDYINTVLVPENIVNFNNIDKEYILKKSIRDTEIILHKWLNKKVYILNDDKRFDINKLLTLIDKSDLNNYNKNNEFNVRNILVSNYVLFKTCDLITMCSLLDEMNIFCLESKECSSMCNVCIYKWMNEKI